MMTQELLSKLFDQQDLTKTEAQALFSEVFNGTTDPAVFAALLTALPDCFVR